METIYLNGTAASSVDEYLEYRRIVGNDDKGKVFTPKEYDEYKKKTLPLRIKNRLYVSFGVPGGMDCKLVGPETSCFCTHRYKQHRTDIDVLPSDGKMALPCLVRDCCCPTYHYIPSNGSQPVRCRCKHSSQDHSEANGHLCKKCSTCSGFQSPQTCGCGQPCSAHQTLVETKTQRELRGLPVGKEVPYAAMGGLTGFSSLADGYLRMDDSGQGTPPLSVLYPEQSGPFQRHVLERTFETASTPGQTEEPRRTEERDMEYFERRYQERLKAEKMFARQRGSERRTKEASSKPSNTSTTYSKQ